MAKAEIVTITNISKYDFPDFDMKALNSEFIDGDRKYPNTNKGYTGPFKEVGLMYQRPQVPVLMWDGDVYPLKSGESIQLPKDIAMNLATKIVDRYLIEQGGVRRLYDPRKREPLFERVITEGFKSAPKKEEVEEEEEEVEEKVETPVELTPTMDMTRAQLLSMAKDSGKKFSNTITKPELINLINEE